MGDVFSSDPVRRRRIRPAVITVTVVVLAAATVGVATLGLGGRHRAAPTTTVHLTATTVTRCTLTSQDSASGRLSHGAATPLPIQASGLITWLPKSGTVVHEGEPLARVDNRPVTLLKGTLPQYRVLRPAQNAPDEGKAAAGKAPSPSAGPPMRGDDVRELKSALRRLGFEGFSDDDRYGSDAVAAVKAWQLQLGEPATGVVGLGDVFYASGPIRTLPAPGVIVGQEMSPSALTRTVSDQVVTATLPAAATWVKVGAKATVFTDDHTSVEGIVASSQVAADSGSGSDGGGIAVVLHVKDQAALNGAGPTVTISHVNVRHAGVLCVPVAALVALVEGGYGLQRGGAPSPAYVAVRTGLFADGRVEVSGDGVVAGLRVEMPDGD